MFGEVILRKMAEMRGEKMTATMVFLSIAAGIIFIMLFVIPAMWSIIEFFRRKNER